MQGIQKIRRLLHLLERLQSGRIFNAADLAEFCGVSRRTIFRDLKALQESGVQVLFDSGKQGYWIPRTAILPPTELSLEETLSLLILAQEVGTGDGGIPFQETARDAAMKLQSNLPAEIQDHLVRLGESIKFQGRRQSVVAEAREHYERLLAACRERRRIRILYHSLYEGQDIRTLLSPYVVLFKRHSWYAIGRSSLHRSVRTFHLGRILESELTDDSFAVPPRFSLKRHFGLAWSMIREQGGPQRVVVRFQPLVAENVADVVWHSTQELHWNADGTLDFTVTVDGLREMSWWIMGYGDQAEVLEPPEMRRLIGERARNLAKLYGERQ